MSEQPDMTDAPAPNVCTHPARHRRPIFDAPADVEYCAGCFTIITRGATDREVEDAIEDVERSDASAFM